MSWDILVDPPQLHEALGADDLVVFDCRFDLQHPQAGRNSWLAGHIPGAAYAHLDEDLAGPVTPQSGRHPLPATDAFAAFLGRAGWAPGKRTVVYDGGGGLIAARLWWLMKYFGAEPCAVLDGGLSAWLAAALPVESGEPDIVACEPPALTPRREYVLSADEVARGLEADEFVLLDARAAERFEGRVEPLDAQAGHVPGARNHPCENNLDERKRMLPRDELHKRFTRYAGRDGSRSVVHMCGSGVTACHNLFAMELAGLYDSRLYVGSWSEWSRDPQRPLAGGPE